MEILNVPRGYGKSTRLIMKAVETGYPIIAMNNAEKREIKRYAEKITNKCIAVYTVDEFLDDGFWRGKIDKKPESVLIDELPFVLKKLLGAKCEMATMTSKSLEEYYMRRNFDNN